VRLFEQIVRPGFGDCAPSGRIRLDAIARWLQDVAYADVEEAGLESVAVWVVRRTRIRVARFPRFGDQFRLTTFCSGLGRMWAERRTTISRLGVEDGDVEAVSLWVHLDTVNWRPIPFSEQEVEVYGPSANGRRVSARLRHRAPGEPGAPGAEGSSWTFRSTELDIAGHINNAAYWQPLEEELLGGAEDPDAIDAEIEFRTPCQPGTKRVLRDGSWRWILGDEGETHASMLLLPHSMQ
jgi:acyl-ACP thioesterase